MPKVAIEFDGVKVFCAPNQVATVASQLPKETHVQRASSETGAPVVHQGRLVTAIRDTAVGVLEAVQVLGMHGKAKTSLATAMRVAIVRGLFGDSASDKAALETLDYLAVADIAFRHLTVHNITAAHQHLISKLAKGPKVRN